MFGKMPKGRGNEIDDAVLTITQREAAKVEWPLRRKWAKGYFAVSAGLLAVLFGRVVFMNVFQGGKYGAMAERNSVRQIPRTAPRGIIYDRYGKPLVGNVPSIGAAIVPVDLPKDDADRERLRNAILSVLHADPVTVDAVLAVREDVARVSPILIKPKLTQEEMISFAARQKEFPGVSLFKSAYREYSDSVIFSHLIGYEGKITETELSEGSDYLPTEMIGKQGVEKGYEDALRGERGYERVEVDALGRPKKLLGSVAAKPGNDLILNIDAELEKKTYDSLQAILDERGLSRGAAVAIDPQDGAVLALVSVPGFDNNLFSEGISNDAYKSLLSDDAKPLFNRAIAGEYAPGSTFKPVMASAALSEGVVDERTEIESKGGISVGSFFFGDWKAHGFTDIRRAIAVSSDVFFYTVGGGYGNISGLGISRIKKYATLFGYGSPSGIDLPGEADGFLPDQEWKKSTTGEPWYIGDDYHSSIGQGFITATPLQIVNSIAAIANGGALYEPRVVSQIRGVDGKTVQNPPKVIREGFIGKDILRIVREGMRETVTDGTAQSLKTLSFPVAGKTGTAQFGTNGRTHGWFVSFAPYDNPKIALIVLVEGQEGDETYNTVPVTKDIYDWYFRERLSGGDAGGQ
ncbi:MAG: penicillin-binding protein 2 [Candidatus Moranbacteria bacterium]|nr:penicillin-binding protein 2 [Candidatus Moranbacteria bacterium]